MKMPHAGACARICVSFDSYDLPWEMWTRGTRAFGVLRRFSTLDTLGMLGKVGFPKKLGFGLSEKINLQISMDFVFNMYATIYYIYVIYMYIYIYEDPRYLTAYYISISSGSQEAAALAPARSTYPTYPLLRQRCKLACEEARNDSAAFDVFSGKIGKSPNSHSEVLRFGASN